MPDTKVTIKPSEAVIAAANAIEYVQSGEMCIGIKKPSILQQFRIIEILGDAAKNDTYMNMLTPVLWVCEIDGEPESPPTTKRELESRIQRLGEEGVYAIVRHMNGKVSAGNGEEALKNS